MNEQRAPRVYGVWVGLVAALFSITQALLLYASAYGSYAGVRSVQQGLNVVESLKQQVVDFTLLLPSLIPMLVVAYGSMLVGGLITVWLAWRAGRMAAIASGRRAGGGRAGMWVSLISSVVWIAASVVMVALTHMDGTVTGILSGTGKPEFTAAEIAGLVAQEVVASLIGLGVCAFAGAVGANSARLVDPEPQPAPAGLGAYPFAVYPAQWGSMPPPTWSQPGAQPVPPPTAGSPANPGAPIPPSSLWSGSQGVYPPPPSHYLPQEPTTPAPGE